MSDFVNYNSRDVNLPAFCKDLSDLLRMLREGRSMPSLADFEIARDENSTGPATELPNHLRAFWEFRGAFAELRITEPDERISVHLEKRFLAETRASITIPPASPYQQPIRQFLQDSHLVWPVEDEFPEAVYPAPAIQVFQSLSPWPQKPDNAARLIANFFEHLQLAPTTSLLFSHLMIKPKERGS